MDKELLSILQYELGEVIDWDELCPGAYYFGVEPNPDSPFSCSEFYLVLPDAPITQEARGLGKTLDGVPGLLYPIDPPEEGGWTAVMYELCGNKAASIPEGWTLADAAIEGMELCPAYFGTFPVPPYTPWGWTFRHRALDNGIYWIETSRCKTVLAVCNPIWTSELSEGMTRAGTTLAPDRGDDNDLEYLFFEGDIICAAIFELLKVRSEWIDTGLIRKPELMNAIWKYMPEYAAAYNAQEQAGLHDALAILLQTLGADSEPQGLPEYMISLSPDAGTDFTGFWK